MRSLISKLRFDRLKEALGGSSSASTPSVSHGRRELVEVQEAVALVESMASDAIAYSSSGQSLMNGDGKKNPYAMNAFGNRVLSLGTSNPASALSGGIGMAMTGLRTAVFLSGDDLTSGLSQLQSLGTRQLPILVHAVFREGTSAGSTHAAYHAASDFGLFQAMPHTAQQAVDLTLLFRWLSERALVPGLLALDRHTVARVDLPTEQLIQEFLGDATDEISSPTASQLILFGGKRTPMPRWFDFDRPVSIGSLQGSNDGASATVGRETFFSQHLVSLLEEGASKLAELTGRTQELIATDRVEDAEIVIVAQGTAYQAARAAACHLRENDRWKVGALGLTWLRPFPTDMLQRALSKKAKILVLESTQASPALAAPLTRELRDCLAGKAGQLMSAHFGMNGQPLHIGQLVKAAKELKENGRRERVWMGITTGRSKMGEFPKREAMIRAVAGDYPSVSETIVEEDGPIDLFGNPKTLLWIGPESNSISELVTSLAEAAGAAGDEVRGVAWAPEPGVLSVRVQAGDTASLLAETGSPIDVLLLGRQGLDLIYNPLSDLREGKKVVIDSDRSPSEVWELMPDFWRSEVKKLGLRLFKVEGGFEELLAAAKALLTDGVDLPFTEIKWKELQEPVSDIGEVPQLIRRVERVTQDYDNIPRFWGEIMQPKRGGISDNFPDPLVTTGTVPPYTAALARPRATALPNIPVLNATKCTGCGDCWPVCPDSAIGVSVIGIQSFLDCAADSAGCEGKIAGAVRRAHRPIAAKLASLLSKKTEAVVTPKTLLEAYEDVSSKMPIAAEEKEEYDRIFAETVSCASAVSPTLTETFFYSSEAAQKGSGELFILSINPDACQGCQICINTCPESALVAEDRGSEARQNARQGWRFWEQLPDTSGATIKKASETLSSGQLSAPLLSRHCSQVQAVGSFGEPGSGERLATRLVTSLLEAHQQEKLSQLATQAKELAEELRNSVQSLLAEGLVGADPSTVEDALRNLPRRRTSLSELSDKLASYGKSINIDPAKTLRLAQTAHQLEDEDWKLVEGIHGLGRARFGLVIMSQRAAKWAGRFPNHSYQSPLIVDPSPNGIDLVNGIANAVIAQHTSRVRLLKKAELLKESPPDLPGRMADLEILTWADLSDDEKKTCPPLLVLTDEAFFAQQGVGSLERIFSSDLPVKLVILDSIDISSGSASPTALGISCNRTFVVSTSLAAPEHLASGIQRLAEYPGPALVHIHVPIPSQHGYTPARTVERANLAVESRIHPLLVFDPNTDGLFGVKLDLSSNPDGAGWGSLNPVEWALGETRFRSEFSKVPQQSSTLGFNEYLELDLEERADSTVVVTDPATEEDLSVSPRLLDFAERRLRTWRVYRELSGVESPFVDSIRSDLRDEIEAAQKDKVAAMRNQYETQIAAIQNDVNGQIAEQLKKRLLHLAGFAQKSAQPGNDVNE